MKYINSKIWNLTAITIAIVISIVLLAGLHSLSVNPAYSQTLPIPFGPAPECTTGPVEELKVLSVTAIGSSSKLYPPQKAVDGSTDPESRWTNLGKDSWIRLDLGDSSIVVCHVEIAWYKSSDRSNTFQVKVYPSEGSEGETFDFASAKGNEGFQTFPLVSKDGISIGSRGQFVKVIFKSHDDNNTSQWASINEIKVFGVTVRNTEPVSRPTIPDIRGQSYNLSSVEIYYGDDFDPNIPQQLVSVNDLVLYLPGFNLGDQILKIEDGDDFQVGVLSKGVGTDYSNNQVLAATITPALTNEFDAIIGKDQSSQPISLRSNSENHFSLGDDVQVNKKYVLDIYIGSIDSGALGVYTTVLDVVEKGTYYCNCG